MKKVTLVTGGFDPVHSGHIDYFMHARALTGYLVVAINSDEWLQRKKGREFMKRVERARIIGMMSAVDEVIFFNDDDNTANDAIRRTLQRHDHVVFANGGDRTSENIPEQDAYEDHFRVSFAFNVGGGKTQSSSWLTNELYRKTIWGEWYVLYQEPYMKVKKLVIAPGKSLSMQRHFHRDESWTVQSGKCHVDTGEVIDALGAKDQYFIPKLQWHRAFNPFDVPCEIVEVQMGDPCIEDDIERV